MEIVNQLNEIGSYKKRLMKKRILAANMESNEGLDVRK